MTDSDAVLAANLEFYRAFATRDLAVMEALWAKTAPVACIHPGWPALADLARIGYCVNAATEQVAVAAFQRRFRPERWDGLIDAETATRLRQVRVAVEDARLLWAERRRRRLN